MTEVQLHKALWSAGGAMALEVEFGLKAGEFVVLTGASGAGKTSILRMLAGLMTPDSGQIVHGNHTWYDSKKGIDLKPQKRGLGLLFQDYALFPAMTVKQNLEFALSKGQDKRQVSDLIDLMELGDLQMQKPRLLSGGQQQRVALARALVNKPNLLLLDEPLSALDRDMRSRLQHYLITVHKELELTTLMVSHDTSEIVRMADRVLVLEQGRIEKEGTPLEVFTHTEISGKFQFTGEVLKVEKQDFLCIVSVLIGKDLVRVVIDEDEVPGLQAGDTVLLASKAFNPVIRKLR